MNAMEIISFLFLTLCSFTAASVVDEITYEDLVKMNASCSPGDTCEGRSSHDGFQDYMCSCDWWCSRLGACCIDSPHRGLFPTVEPTCRTVGDECSQPDSFYMVDRCGASGYTNPLLRRLCEMETKGHIVEIAPVTSLSTAVTYKNYFCFRCHETTNKFFYWNADFRDADPSFRSYSVVDSERFTLRYDSRRESWLAEDGDGTTIKMKLIFEIPYKDRNLAVPCPSNLITECSESWTDEKVRSLCKAYAIPVRNGRSEYKNVHCAICNFLKVEDMRCRNKILSHCHNIVSLRKFFDLNKIDVKNNCEEDSIWDLIAMKCIKFGCLMPGYVLKGKICVSP